MHSNIDTQNDSRTASVGSGPSRDVQSRPREKRRRVIVEDRGYKASSTTSEGSPGPPLKRTKGFSSSSESRESGQLDEDESIEDHADKDGDGDDNANNDGEVDNDDEPVTRITTRAETTAEYSPEKDLDPLSDEAADSEAVTPTKTKVINSMMAKREAKREAKKQTRLAKRAPYLVGIDKNDDNGPHSKPAQFDGGADSCPSKPVTLADLEPLPRSLQARYWGLFADNDLVRCDTCSRSGHLTPQCPSRVCKHCRKIDAHFSAACPLVRLCTKCRSRGHAALSCPSKLARSAADGFTCGICGGPHRDELCSWLWRTFTPAGLSPLLLRTVNDMRVSCYECGAAGHWGDDCLSRPRAKISQCDTFSTAFASQFSSISAPPKPPQQQQQNRRAGTNGFSIRGRSGGTASLHPRNGKAPRTDANFNDSSGDEARAFYGGRVDRAPQRGGIQIAYRAPIAAQQQQPPARGAAEPRPLRRTEPQMAFGPPAHYDNGVRKGYQPPLPDERPWRPRPPV